MALMMSQPRIDVESPVVPVVSFDPPVVKPGQRAIYRLTFNALETSITFPPITARPALELKPAAHAQILVLTGTNYQPRTSFNFRLQPTAEGQITIPAFKASVYGKEVLVPAASLQVTASPPPGLPPAQVLRLEIPHTNVYVGQAVHASVTLPPMTSLVLQHSSPLQLNGQGFLVDQNTLRPGRDSRFLGPGNANTLSLAYDLVLTPIKVGDVSFFAQAFVGNRLATAVGGIGLGLQYTLVDSEPVQLRVAPLPKEGQLPGFTGAVGSFVADPPQLSTNVLRVGEPVKLAARIRGDGNLLRLVPPPPPKADQWRIFSGEPNPTHPQIVLAQGATIFNFLLVPLSESARQTPEIAFSCFDPAEGKYVDCTIPSVAVTVLPGSAPADLSILEQADKLPGKSEKEPVLSGLADSQGLGAGSLVPLQKRSWFVLAQLGPAVAFLGLWTWERRKRYYQLHPDELLRRRARRAWRRQWRLASKAATRGSEGEFVSAAIQALDVACSPFYPADPRALVGSDVLALLSEEEKGSPQGKAVHALFEASDAGRFSVGAPNGASGLLELRPQIKTVLEWLDRKLRA